MEVQAQLMNLKDNQQIYLDKACQEEAAGNNQEAERLFELALQCEEFAQTELSDLTTNKEQAISENGITNN